ncbi:MAG: hypothetical protein GVY11_05790 [Gammaproteobacteria bacterium]|jgi:hypothetical protein|nr:hypothetical protein [Gammaproteobacteria bacterium]
MSKCKWIMAGMVLLASLHPANTHGAAGVPAPQQETQGTGLWRVGRIIDSVCDHHDIQDAIDATAANDGEFSTINIRVSGQASIHEGNTYVIDAEEFENVTHIRVIGGHNSCSDTSPSTDPSDRTILDANESGRVFDLLYNASLSDPTVTMELENLDIRGGLAPSAGGGIRIQGHAGHQRVHLNNVRVRDNATTSLGSGGGISLEATSTASGSIAWFRMSQNSKIELNDAAGAGGGFACFNSAGSDNPPVVLFETDILGNEADFSGGGVVLSGCRNVSIRMDATGSGGSIAFNTAGADQDGNGGGVHASNGAQLTLEASGAEYSALVHANEADRGGGIAVEGADTVAASQVEVVNASIDGNTARVAGGAFYVADEASLVMGRHGGVTGAGTCEPLSDPFVRCSRITNNTSQGNAGAIAVQSDGQAAIFQTIIGENTADVIGLSGGATHVSGAQSSLLLEGAWVHSNSGSPILMSVTDDAEMQLRWSTIAGNSDPNDGSGVFRLESGPEQGTLLDVDASIVWEPTTTLVGNPDGDATATGYCVIGHVAEGLGFDSVDFYSDIDPRLIHPSGGDLRLDYDSPAIDYCDDAIAPQFGDMFNNNRGGTYNLETIDPPSSVPGGTFDIGGHERDPVQIEIFDDRFEG